MSNLSDFVGGGAAAETGTWTPTITDWAGTSLNISSSEGTYTRVGNIVHVTFKVTGITQGSAQTGSTAKINGLPFSIASGNEANGHADIDYSQPEPRTYGIVNRWVAANNAGDSFLTLGWTSFNPSSSFTGNFFFYVEWLASAGSIDEASFTYITED